MTTPSEGVEPPTQSHRHEWVTSAETGQIVCLTCPMVVVDFAVIDVAVDDDE